MTTTHQMGKTTHQMGKTSPLYSTSSYSFCRYCARAWRRRRCRGIGLYSKLKTVDVQRRSETWLWRLRSAARRGISGSFEFTPLLGGQKSKSQLDDFTNVDV